jgi:lipopolysaccharide transport system permease protein
VKTLLEPFRLLYLHRSLIAQAAAAELRYRTAGLSFGALWLVLAPLLLLVVYSVVYLAIFRVRAPDMTETQYVVYLFCGLVPFLAIAEAMMASLPALSGHAHLLASTVFPIEIIPVRAVLGSQSGFAAGMVIVLAAALWAGRPTLAWWLLVPLVALQLLFAIGLAWVLSVASVLFRDLQHMVGLVITLLLVLSPIAYTPDMLPAQLRGLIWFNPLAYFVVAYQQILMFGVSPPLYLAGALALGLGAFVGGFAVLARLKRVVSDYA